MNSSTINNPFIIYVPGLGDQLLWNKSGAKIIPLFWHSYGYNMYIFKPLWMNSEIFDKKLERLLDCIDRSSKKYGTLSLLGQSAGGSLILNAYSRRTKKIHGVINATGRLRRGRNVKPSMEWAARNSPSFFDSVITFEDKNEPKLSDADRKRVITVRPHLDFIVPKSTVPLRGATNITAPFIDHSIGGVMICTLYAERLVGFLKSLERQ